VEPPGTIDLLSVSLENRTNIMSPYNFADPQMRDQLLAVARRMARQAEAQETPSSASPIEAEAFPAAPLPRIGRRWRWIDTDATRAKLRTFTGNRAKSVRRDIGDLGVWSSSRRRSWERWRQFLRRRLQQTSSVDSWNHGRRTMIARFIWTSLGRWLLPANQTAMRSAEIRGRWDVARGAPRLTSLRYP
jgi:hypothetical protein